MKIKIKYKIANDKFSTFHTMHENDMQNMLQYETHLLKTALTETLTGMLAIVSP